MTISTPQTTPDPGVLFMHGLKAAGDVWVTDTHAQTLNLESAAVGREIIISRGKFDRSVSMVDMRVGLRALLNEVYSDGPVLLRGAVVDGIMHITKCSAATINLTSARVAGPLHITHNSAPVIDLTSVCINGGLVVLGRGSAETSGTPAKSIEAPHAIVRQQALFRNIAAQSLSLTDAHFDMDLCIQRCRISGIVHLKRLFVGRELWVYESYVSTITAAECRVTGRTRLTQVEADDKISIYNSNLSSGLEISTTKQTDRKPKDTHEKPAPSLELILCSIGQGLFILGVRCKSLSLNSIDAGHIVCRGIHCTKDFKLNLSRATSFEFRGASESHPTGEGGQAHIDRDLIITGSVFARSVRIHDVLVGRYTMVGSLVAHTLSFGRLERTNGAVTEKVDTGSDTENHEVPLRSAAGKWTSPNGESSSTPPNQEFSAANKSLEEISASSSSDVDNKTVFKAASGAEELQPRELEPKGGQTPGPNRVRLGAKDKTHLCGGLLVVSSAIQSTMSMLGLRVGKLDQDDDPEFWDADPEVPAQMRAAREAIVIDNCEIGRSLNIYGRCAGANEFLMEREWLRGQDDQYHPQTPEEFHDEHEQPLAVRNRIEIRNTRIGSELDLRDLDVTGTSKEYGQDADAAQTTSPHIRIDGVSTGSHIRMEPVLWATKASSSRRLENHLLISSTSEELDRFLGGETICPRVVMNAVQCGGDLRLSGIRPPKFEAEMASATLSPQEPDCDRLVMSKVPHCESGGTGSSLNLPSIDLRNVEVGGDLELYSPRPTVEDFVDVAGYGYLRAEGAVRIESCRISGKIDARSVWVKQKTLITDVHAKAGLKLDTDWDSVDCKPARLDGGLFVRRLHTEGDVDMWYVKAGGIEFTQCRIAGELLLCTELPIQRKRSYEHSPPDDVLGTHADCTGRVLIEDSDISGIAFCERTFRRMSDGSEGSLHALRGTTVRRLRAFVDPKRKHKPEIDVRGLSVTTWDFRTLHKSGSGHIPEENGAEHTPEDALGRFLLLIRGNGPKTPRPRDVLLSIERSLIERWEYELAELVRHGMLSEGMTRAACDKSFERIVRGDYGLRRFMRGLSFFAPPIAANLLFVPIFHFIKIGVWQSLFHRTHATRSKHRRLREVASTSMLRWFGYGTPFRYVSWLFVLWSFSGIVVLGSPKNIRPSIEAVESNSARLVGQSEQREAIHEWTAQSRSSVVDPWQPPMDWGIPEGLLLASHYVLPMIELPVKEEWRPAPGEAPSLQCTASGSQDRIDKCGGQAASDDGVYGWNYFGLCLPWPSPEFLMFLVTVNAWLIWPLILLSIAGMVRRANLHG
ncbi:MAG: hypothetical protein ACTS3F_02615 [Phycisphaerales bacterium]